MKRPVPDGFTNIATPQRVDPENCRRRGLRQAPFPWVHRFCGVNACIASSLTSCVAFSLGSP